MSWVAAVALASAATSAAAATAPDPTQQAVDRRIETLRSTLRITPSQTRQWDRFATTMRENAAATDALFRDRAGSLATLDAADALKSYASVARAYADDTQTLSQAFQPLYASLSEPQKRLADALFRQQAGVGRKK